MVQLINKKQLGVVIDPYFSLVLFGYHPRQPAKFQNYVIINFLMKKPFIYALAATLYIIVIVLVVQAVTSVLKSQSETIIIPMTMLSLFVLSAAVMGFLFLSEPLYLLVENRKQEAIVFFAKVVGIFACFVALFVILLLFI